MLIIIIIIIIIIINILVACFWRLQFQYFDKSQYLIIPKEYILFTNCSFNIKLKIAHFNEKSDLRWMFLGNICRGVSVWFRLISVAGKEKVCYL